MNTTILNREFKHPADGWYQIEAKGFHPCMAEQNGQQIKVVQVIDDKAITSIVNRFNEKAAAGQLPQGNEMLIDREHFKDNPEKETVAYGWAKKMRVSPDGSGFDVEKPWTRTGQQAVDGGDYRFFSTEYDGPTDTCFEPVPAAEIPVAIRNKYSGFKFLRPLELTGLTLTNAHNNKGQKAITIANRKTFADTSVPAANQQPQHQARQMKQIATKLGLAAEASEDAILAELTKIQNRVTELEPLADENIKLTKRLTAVDGNSVDALLVAHGVTDTKIQNRLKPVLLGYEQHADRVSALVDFGYKAVEAGKGASTQTKLHNRETRAPGAAGAASETTEAAQKVSATKIMNRAHAIMKEVKNVSLATATRMAQEEIEAAQ